MVESMFINTAMGVDGANAEMNQQMDEEKTPVPEVDPDPTPEDYRQSA
jgi:hypothetical protein